MSQIDSNQLVRYLSSVAQRFISIVNFPATGINTRKQFGIVYRATTKSRRGPMVSIWIFDRFGRSKEIHCWKTKRRLIYNLSLSLSLPSREQRSSRQFDRGEYRETRFGGGEGNEEVENQSVETWDVNKIRRPKPFRTPCNAFANRRHYIFIVARRPSRSNEFFPPKKLSPSNKPHNSFHEK